MKFSLFNRSLLFLTLSFVILFACGPRHYTQEDLKELNTKEVQGIIVEQKRGYFVLKDEAGQEKIYRTGRVTQYIPRNYVPQAGDSVRASIQEVLKYLERPQVDKRVVYQVEALQVAEENKAIPNPIKGRITGFAPDAGGYSRSLFLDISAESPLIMHISSWETEVDVYGRTGFAKNINWKASIDKDVEIIAKREPARWRSGYIYVAEKVSFLNVDDQPE
ncbi:MAG: hypothetical protein OEV42_06410 [Deltaproteobacteria bacterium]|nr:hypothetical protein [Deltaproteobacteria bacterium]